MLKTLKNKYVLFNVKKKEKWEKAGKEMLLLLIPENIRDRKLSVCKSVKYQLNIENGIRCFKN